ncbi:MAG: hypothetical protein MUF42_10010 [Cytophagaceae bacterium]|jgi:hypothetical protein|nr:hypothetical protein [Cytophagaceae bacterium]
MNKLEYFKIGPSVDPKITGVFKSTQLNDFVDSENSSRERFEKYQLPNTKIKLPIDQYDLHKFKLHDNSFPTNILYSSFLDLAGMFVSENLMEVIKNNNTLYKVFFFEASAYQKSLKLKYYFMNIIENIELINFEKSEFIFDKRIEKVRTGGVTFKVKNIEEYREKKMNTPIEFSGKVILPKKIVLNESYDLMAGPFSSNFLISKNLKDKIVSAGINDVSITPISYEEYYLS